MIGWIYFFVIIVANTIGAIAGIGGGILIKPILDTIGAHSASEISFYSTVAVLTMSIVSVLRRMKQSQAFKLSIITWIALGSIVGGILGNSVFEWLLAVSGEKIVQWVQISLTILTLIFALVATEFSFSALNFQSRLSYGLSGLILGFLASLLGIGGGPINVALFMLFFGFSIKIAAVYSLGTIFFSQLAKVVTISLTIGFARYDLTLLWYVIAAAVIGGLLGAKFSKILREDQVQIVFRVLMAVVLLINLYNGYQLI